MSPDQWRQLRESFDGAIALPEKEREAFLDAVRASDPLVAEELMGLLTRHFSDDSTLEAPALSRNVMEHALDLAQRSDPDLLQAGFQIDNRYEITSLLGEGGFGRVYLASDRRLDNRKVVIKILKHTHAHGFKKRLQEEVRSLSRLDHPGVVAVSDTGTLSDGVAYLVMQYVPGLSLKDLLRQGLLPQARSLVLIRQTAEALSVAHAAGILHRDVKPGNIIVRDAGQPAERAVLIDFGIARTGADDPGNQQTASSVVGSPLYMAPEQMLGRTSYATDVYSLGAVAFEMYTGQSLLESTAGKNVETGARHMLAAVQPPLPDTIIDALIAAVAADPQRRTSSPREFADALTARPEPARKSSLILWLAAVVIAIAIGSVWYASREHTPLPTREFHTTISRRTSSGPQLLRAGDPLHAGDGIEINFTAPEPGSLYLFDESSSLSTAQFTLLYPGIDQTGIVVANHGQRIPSLTGAWIEIDGEAPRESIWLVWSTRRIDSLEAFRRYSSAPLYGAVPSDAAGMLRQWLSGSRLSQPSRADGLLWRSSDDPFVVRVTFPVE